MKRVLQKLFFGYCVLEQRASNYNGRIEVWEDLFGKKRLMVGGLTQSGDKVEQLWENAFAGFKICNSLGEGFKNCLILGLGAGSVAKLISELCPQVKIFGMEIDPGIITLGKKYFGLNEIPNLEIETSDAVATINNRQPIIGNPFDLVLVDLYLGDQVPQSSETDEFLQSVKKYLAKNGAVVFNRLYYGKKIENTDIFEEKLTNFFAKVEARKISMNKLFLCRI